MPLLFDDLFHYLGRGRIRWRCVLPVPRTLLMGGYRKIGRLPEGLQLLLPARPGPPGRSAGGEGGKIMLLYVVIALGCYLGFLRTARNGGGFAGPGPGPEARGPAQCPGL